MKLGDADMIFNMDKMGEAEVSLRLAIYLIENNLVVDDVRVAIDGAQIKTGELFHFDIHQFFLFTGMTKLTSDDKWQGTYKLRDFDYKIHIHSKPGEGDLSAKLSDGRNLLVESKKGDLIRRPGGKEYPLLREAIGQLVTIETELENTLIFVAIPKSDKNSELVNRWKNAPLVKRLNLGFIMIDRDQNMESTLSITVET